MVMSWFWTLCVFVSLMYSMPNGTLSAVSTAATEGAGLGVELCISMAGTLCLWSGVMEALRQSGALDTLGRLLRPMLGKLYPQHQSDEQIMGAISANLSANLLGLGNAATPFGIQAACAMAKHTGGVASDALCMLVVCNTASIQLLPVTVASLRSAAGCESPMDILPAVWLSSLLSVTVGICAAKLFAALERAR